jgi:hypothetical protein
MGDIKLNRVDGLPEWKGRKVETELQKRRAAKRARRFVMIEWGDLVPALHALDTDRATRLLLLLLLQDKLQRVRTKNGWIELVKHDLEAVDLADSNLTKWVVKLETLGLIEVQRRLGKRPLLRLIKLGNLS